MSGRRVALVVTSLAVAALGGVLAVLRSDTAGRVATVVSALAAVATVGDAVWAALPLSGGARVRVSNTGNATAGLGGTATSGVIGPARTLGSVEGIQVDHTGDAEASGGDGTSGVRLT